MAIVTDILFDPDTGDLACKDGDFVVGDSTFRHQADLLEAAEGEYKQYPTVGVGLNEFLNDENPAEMLRKIRIQFVRDGLNITELSSAEQLKISAEYS